MILNNSVRVTLIYGDADYIANWFGGQAVSLAANFRYLRRRQSPLSFITNFPFSHAKEFRAAGYVPMMVEGVEYGETREYGNFSFTRVYEAGHEVRFSEIP